MNLFNNNTNKIKIGGWIPDPASKKYFKFDKSSLKLNANSIQYKSTNGDEIDLRPYTSTRHNQLNTSSCVGNAVIKALEIKRILQYGHENHVDLSILDLYYHARERMTPPTVNVDGGTHISLACDVLRDIGVCRDIKHPFVVKNINKKPSIMATREARLNRITSHFKIKSYGNERIDDMLFNLKAGNPIVFGTTVGSDWMEYKGGKNPITGETRPIGGHAMACIGFVNGLFIIENSWSTRWGEDGFGYVTPEVFKNASTRDLWVIVNGSEAWSEK